MSRSGARPASGSRVLRRISRLVNEFGELLVEPLANDGKPLQQQDVHGIDEPALSGELIGSAECDRRRAGLATAEVRVVGVPGPVFLRAQTGDQIPERVEQDRNRDDDHDPEHFRRQREERARRQLDREFGLQVEPADHLFGEVSESPAASVPRADCPRPRAPSAAADTRITPRAETARDACRVLLAPVGGDCTGPSGNAQFRIP